MLELIFFVVAVVCPFWIAYSVGMAEYIKNNVATQKEEENRMWSVLLDETNELKEAIVAHSLIDVIMEASDVVHSFIKYISIRYLPRVILVNPLYWSLIFWFVQPTSFKHGKRHLFSNCIRNHSNPKNCDHICDYYPFCDRLLGYIFPNS